MPRVVALFNEAVDHEPIDRNPFRGLGQRGKGRSDKAPSTVGELERLLDGCSALGDYAGQMRALIIFGAYTGMRPSEPFALEWADITLQRKGGRTVAREAGLNQSRPSTSGRPGRKAE